MNCKKYVEIVAETETHLIATVWTGANYYIDCFGKEMIDGQIAWAAESGVHLTAMDVIAHTSVLGMELLCRNEDYSQDLLKEEVERYKQIVARIDADE